MNSGDDEKGEDGKAVLGSFIMRGRIICDVKMFTGNEDERSIKWPGRAVGVAACPGVVNVRVL
jgi:hypothetical protein